MLRSKDSLSEPNDEAIRRAPLEESTRDDVTCIALVTSDTDFLDTLVRLQNNYSGLSFVVLIPERKHAVLGKYSNANIRVVQLKAAFRGSRVPCKGNGSVHLADPYVSFDNSAAGKLVCAFLKDFGFMGDNGILVQAAAKFWYANQLGSLTVYPPQLATISVHEVMQGSREDYERYTTGLAFVQPVSSKSRSSKAGLRKYGSAVARPFMLEDSPELTAQVLRRLGYLDDDLNDFTEALFCFANSAENKKNMETVWQTSWFRSQKFPAFLSQGSHGDWQHIRKDKSAMQPVVIQLQKAKVIGRAEYASIEVFEGMEMYLEQHGLRTMQTFNGRALRILQHIERSPDRRALIEVKP